MKLLVIVDDATATQYGVDRVLKLDLNAFLRMPLAEVVALEDEMAGAPSLKRIGLDLGDYPARVVHAVAWLALRQAGKSPDWAAFEPDLAECQYVRDVSAAVDADPGAWGLLDGTVREFLTEYGPPFARFYGFAPNSLSLLEVDAYLVYLARMMKGAGGG